MTTSAHEENQADIDYLTSNDNEEPRSTANSVSSYCSDQMSNNVSCKFMHKTSISSNLLKNSKCNLEKLI